MATFILLVFVMMCIIWLAALLLSVGLAIIVLSGRLAKLIFRSIMRKVNYGGN